MQSMGLELVYNHPRLLSIIRKGVSEERYWVLDFKCDYM